MIRRMQHLMRFDKHSPGRMVRLCFAYAYAYSTYFIYCIFYRSSAVFFCHHIFGPKTFYTALIQSNSLPFFSLSFTHISPFSFWRLSHFSKLIRHLIGLCMISYQSIFENSHCTTSEIWSIGYIVESSLFDKLCTTDFQTNSTWNNVKCTITY